MKPKILIVEDEPAIVDNIQYALEIGADDYVVKPFSIDCVRFVAVNCFEKPYLRLVRAAGVKLWFYVRPCSRAIRALRQ